MGQMGESGVKNQGKKQGKSKIEILIANDDGIKSQGIQALAKALQKVGNVTVVAPEREQSTMGHALTLHKPVRLFHVHAEKGMNQWALSGTPADCVYMGIRYVLKKRPDIIVSGINNGVNLGNDIYYSGTIAAAREGAVLDIPAIACSLDYMSEPGSKSNPNFDTAAKYIAHLVPQVLKNRLPSNCLLNVNFPNLPFDKIKGVRISRQGFRIYTDAVKELKDSRGKSYFWLAGTYAGFRPIEGSDCEVIDRGFISITPCRIDVTQYEFMENLSQWDLDPAKGVKKTSRVKKVPRKKK
jgi:5'-nucleotidase